MCESCTWKRATKTAAGVRYILQKVSLCLESQKDWTHCRVAGSHPGQDSQLLTFIKEPTVCEECSSVSASMLPNNPGM